MSLLMKALKTAEENQRSAGPGKEPSLNELEQELSLDPLEPAPETPPGAGKGVPREAHAAANLFQAKQGSQSAGKGGALPWVAAAGIVLLVVGGTYVYVAINYPTWLQFSSVAVPPASPPVSTPAIRAAPSRPAIAERPPSPPVPLLAEESPRAIPPKEAQPKAAPVTPSPSDEAIRVLPGSQSGINADQSSAYRAFQEGRLDEAQAHYQRFLQQEPRNLDALLGLAAVTGRRGQIEDAARYYLQALELEPRNAVAQAGLVSLLGQSDPAGSEARLRQLLTQQPAAAFLHFALGNLLSGQARWNEAQQAYFQAYHLDADNPDHAFNLAVSLEHLNQPAPALTYYRRALELLPGRGAGFERGTAEARIAKLQQGQD